jgi:hypothetical protein
VQEICLEKETVFSSALINSETKQINPKVFVYRWMTVMIQVILLSYRSSFQASQNSLTWLTNKLCLKDCVAQQQGAPSVTGKKIGLLDRISGSWRNKIPNFTWNFTASSTRSQYVEKV